MLKCQACQVPLCRTLYEGMAVDVCPQCGGALVEEPRLDAIKRVRRLRWSEAEQRHISARVVTGDSAAPRRCPRCLAFMEKIKVWGGAWAFHLDRCKPCNVFWMDRGELELVQIQYEKEVDSRTPEDWARIERAAVAEMRMKEAARESTETELAAPGQVAQASRHGPVAVAAVVAQWAAESVQEGLDEEVPVRRQWSFIRAAILLLIVALLLLAAYYLGWDWGPRWWRHGM